MVGVIFLKLNGRNSPTKNLDAGRIWGDDSSTMPLALLLFIAFSLCAANLSFAASPATILWYAQPAQKWTDALPIGNGRMGAMIFGGIFDERIQFNEDTLWKGQPHDYVRAGAGEQLTEIRSLLAAGNVTNATALARSNFLSDPVRQKAYQPFGDLRLHFSGAGEAGRIIVAHWIWIPPSPACAIAWET